MAAIKSYTDIEQSKILSKILPLESADMYWYIAIKGNPKAMLNEGYNKYGDFELPCWSLAALLNILHSRQGDIPSLSGGGYKDGKYISDWCLDYEYDNGNYQKTFADNPVDACVAMIEKLNELKML